MTFNSKTGSHKASSADTAYGNIQKAVCKAWLKDKGERADALEVAIESAKAGLTMLALIITDNGDNKAVSDAINTIVGDIIARDWQGYTLPGTEEGTARDRKEDLKSMSATIATKAFRPAAKKIA